MPALPTDLRNQLGKAVVAARREAEAGARRALEALAVERHEPHGSMGQEERKLRNRLRARGRQLGDFRNRARGDQSIDRLAHEVAYEHWHRMLFARFLAENQLLIEPDSGVAVTLAEVEELAREAGENPRDMAARFAQDSLPQIFRTADPVLEVALAPETRQALDRLLDDLPATVFTADDSLGWTYQYWQSEKKDEVNASGNKIGADELPAVTQLFTEHYMVQFLFHNAIGAWHASKVLTENPDLVESAESEDELRRAVPLRAQGGYNFDYLRFVREAQEGDEEDSPTGPWRPAAGTFDRWPTTAAALKILDPCCGSGHFLVEGFELLVRLRMDEEGIDLEDAIDGVLADNLHGLEIDPRCTQIAAFNLAMAAWKVVGRPIDMPAINIACSGLALGSTRNEWVALAGDGERLRAGMERLYQLFEQAPELGSLIDPKALEGDMLVADFAELRPLLAQALERESDNVEDVERAVAAQGMARAEELMGGEYTLAITNVPYLAKGKQSDSLMVFAATYYEEAKADLATVLLERMLHWIGRDGSVAAVTPQNWLFLTTYKRLRESLLNRRTWNVVARLGSGAFETIRGEIVNVALVSISAGRPGSDWPFGGIDASVAPTPQGKATLLRGEPVAGLEEGSSAGAARGRSQARQLRNPDARVLLSPSVDAPLLSKYAHGVCGLVSKDSPCFFRRYWEVPTGNTTWELMQTTTETTQWFGGMEQAVLWENGQGLLHYRGSRGEAILAGGMAWGKAGVLVSQMGQLPCCLFVGDIFDNNAAVLLPTDSSSLPAIWAYTSSSMFRQAVREIDQSIKVTNASLVKVPFDLERWQKVAAEKYPNGLPEP